MTPETLYCGPPVPPAALAFAWRLDAVAIALILALLWLGRAGPSGPSRAAAALLALLYLSPLCALAAGLFSARALHHVILVSAVAPLLALVFPARGARALWPALGAMTLVLWVWHLPAAYAFGVTGAGGYWAMQASLLAASLLFWRAAFAAPPGEALTALLLAGMQMGMLGALLTFAGRPLYALHLLTAAPYGLTALEDQQLGGLVMWVPGALPWLIAAALIAWRGLRPRTAAS